jgi:hypothetical protein
MTDSIVKPLEWYEKPDGQKTRIGRCGQISYGVSFEMGNWGYRRRGDVGHVVSRPGTAFFNSEADAMRGAEEDHEARALSALTADPRAMVAAALERAAEVASIHSEYSAEEVAALMEKEPTEMLEALVQEREGYWKANCQANAAAMAMVEEALGQLLPTQIRHGAERGPDPVEWAQDMIAALHKVRDKLSEAEARGYRQGQEDEREACATGARLAMVNNSDADELTCSICASAIRARGGESDG